MMGTIWNNQEKYDAYFPMEIGMYQVIQLIWIKMVISGFKDGLMM